MQLAVLTGFVDELEKIAAHYHGSTEKLTSLRAGSYVTPYAHDAAVFGVPWGSKELTHKGGKDGRPPKKLSFKGTPPKDRPVYVYSVDTPTTPADTNTGRTYAWNKKVTEEAPVKLVRTLPSWQAELLQRG